MSTTAKRRKLDVEVQKAQTVRQRAAAQNRALQASQQPAKTSYSGDTPYTPLIAMSSLPVAALSRYALHYGLISSEPLTASQAVHPTPPLPTELRLAGSSMIPQRRRASLVPERASGHESSNGASPNGSTAANLADNSTKATKLGPSAVKAESESSDNNEPRAINGKKRKRGSDTANDSGYHTAPSAYHGWSDLEEPVDPELQGMTAFGGGVDQLRDRLGALAKAHWEKTPIVKEGETIINFAYAVRMRSKVLKSVPAN